MLEATLTLTLFLTLLFPLFDFGYDLFLHQTFASQARLGARYGAVNPGDTTKIKNMVLYASTSGSGNGFMGLAPSSVTVTRQGTAGGDDDRIQVVISGYSRVSLTPGYSGSHTGNRITVVMPVEN